MEGWSIRTHEHIPQLFPVNVGMPVDIIGFEVDCLMRPPRARLDTFREAHEVVLKGEDGG